MMGEHWVTASKQNNQGGVSLFVTAAMVAGVCIQGQETK